VWAARDAGLLEAGAPLLVCLAIADRANNGTGVARMGVRGLAHRTGLSAGTIVAALRVGVTAGALELVEPGRGSRPARYRIALPTARAKAGENDAGAFSVENANENPARVRRSASDTQRSASDTQAFSQRNETGLDLLNSYEPEGQSAHADDDVVPPDEVAARMAEAAAAVRMNRRAP
jgi:hypothetical protein